MNSARKQKLPFEGIYKDRNVLVTGHTGFKGSWLSLWLSRFGANITGISLPPITQPSLFELSHISQLVRNHFSDIRDRNELSKIVRKAEPEIVFHMAAQPLVRLSYERPVETFSTNIMGTVHLLESLREVDSIKVIVIITTDKVYRNLEWAYPYREVDVLGGHDPYSASKAACEIVTESYRDSFFKANGVAIATARAGNVIGGGDWSADRLIPDAIRAWSSEKTLIIRNPEAVRPWQHVLEPLFGYLKLAQKLWFEEHMSGSYNFGPITTELATVKDVVEIARKYFGKGEVCYGNLENSGPHEAGFLSLEIAKAKNMLGVNPKWNLSEGLKRTINWYIGLSKGKDSRMLCGADIDDYEAGL